MANLLTNKILADLSHNCYSAIINIVVVAVTVDEQIHQ